MAYPGSLLPFLPTLSSKRIKHTNQWEHKQAVLAMQIKQDEIIDEILAALAKLFRASNYGEGTASATPTPAAAAVDALARSALTRRLRLLYSCLGSERPKVNAASCY